MADYSSTSELDELQRTSREVKRRLEAQMLVNLCFYQGHQWVAFDGLRLYEPELAAHRAKVTDNRVRPMMRAEIAKKTKTRPVWVGVPTDDSDEEMAAARLRERVWEHEWKALNTTRKLRAALLWAGICGAGFWKVWWDSTVGDQLEVLVDRNTGKSVKNQTGAPIPASMLDQLPAVAAELYEPRKVGMGDVSLQVKTPFEIFPSPLAGEEGIESAEWIIEESIYSPAYLAKHFGSKADGLNPDAQASAGITEAKMPGLPGATDAQLKKGVRVREYWCAPGSEHPKGKRVVWANDRVLLESDHPYEWLPYVMFRGQPVPGRFWPDGSVTDWISRQTSLNKRESQIEENADRIGNPPLVISSHNDDVDWQGLPGEKLVFQDTGTPGAVPSFMQVPELPGYVREDVGRIEQSLREISGQHEVAQGSVPSGVTAAAAISMLLEQVDSVFAPDIEDMETTLTDAGRRVLRLMADNASDERLARISGEDGAIDLQAFRGKDLRSADHDSIQVGSGIPQSKAAKQAAIQEVLNMFAQMGVQIPERDMRRVLQEYQVGGLEKFFAGVGKDERQVNRENQRMVAGTPLLPINAYDNDPVHIAGHQDFQKSAAYERQSDQVKQIFAAHVQAHLDRQQSVADSVAASQGQGPPPPAAAAAQPPVEGIGGSGPSEGVPSAQP